LSLDDPMRSGTRPAPLRSDSAGNARQMLRGNRQVVATRRESLDERRNSVRIRPSHMSSVPHAQRILPGWLRPKADATRAFSCTLLEDFPHRALEKRERPNIDRKARTSNHSRLRPIKVNARQMSICYCSASAPCYPKLESIITKRKRFQSFLLQKSILRISLQGDKQTAEEVEKYYVELVRRGIERKKEVHAKHQKSILNAMRRRINLEPLDSFELKI
jgi:hypothetical protein